MPRLLSRLVDEVQRARARSAIQSNLKRSDFLKKTSQRVVHRLLNCSQTFAFRGRNKSILLDTINPILHREQFLRKKSELRKPLSQPEAYKKKDGQKVMSFAERGLSSNPYLRMLSSPIRQCLFTEKHLPIDFMIRLSILQVSNDPLNDSHVALLPDGLEHPRFRRRNNGRGCYIICYKEAIHTVCTNRKKLRRIPSNVKVHSLLGEQIVAQLRNRVLKELELLTERLRCSPFKSRETMVVRKLTRFEWDSIRSTGQLSQSGAVAILIVPPVKRRSLTEEPRNYQQSQLSPLFQLYPNDHIFNYSSTGLQLPMSPNMIPVYNGVALFPLPHLRHELHQRLQILLTAERNARWRQKTSAFSHPFSGKDKMKSSHAYIILADHDTVQRSDSIPLAIALWRLRLWEGFGWDQSEQGDYGGWCI